jgi:hypothetical protein
MTTQPSESRYAVIATGVFTVCGTDISGSTTDLISLSGGTFKIHHGGALDVIKEQLNRASGTACGAGRRRITSKGAEARALGTQ